MQSRKILWLFIGCLFFKFILFDLDWSLNTTFSVSLYTLQMVSDYSRYID